MTRTTVSAILTLLLVGCGDGGGGDGGPDTDATGNTDPTSASDPSVGPASNPSDPSSESSSTEPDPTMADSSTGDNGCTEQNECIVTDDCLPGQTCIGCLCLGDGMGCAEWGEGAYGDCVPETGVVNNTACMGGGATCLVDNTTTPNDGVCIFSCDDACDCPQPPEGFEAQVECTDVTGEGTGDCFIGCAGGGQCPEGMYCFMGALCFHGDAPMGLPPYGDCVNEPGPCEDGICLQDNVQNPAWGFCGPFCESNDDCPEPETGSVAEQCIQYNQEGDSACALPCTLASTCPDGMSCALLNANSGICAWDIEDEPMPPPPYGDCENNPVDEACAATDACIEAADDAGSVCAGPCVGVEDCAAAPNSGDAVLTCGDLGDGNVCHLSCAMGETCPDGMACFDETYCHFQPS